MSNLLSRLRLLPDTLREAMGLTFQLKRTFDEGGPISEALSIFTAPQETFRAHLIAPGEVRIRNLMQDSKEYSGSR